MQVLIADDHDLVRDTVAAFLQTCDGTRVSTASSLPTALDVMASSGPFDVVLLDFEMPGMDGLAGLARARAANRDRPVGILSGTVTRRDAEEALAAGAAGILPKTMSARSMLNAVQFMAMGEVLAPVSFLSEREENPAHAFDKMLSEREGQVLEGLTRGLSNKEIARELGLQEVTIKLHVKTLSRKLDARNRTHAAMIAKEAGFV